jgi:hypothetical protein
MKKTFKVFGIITLVVVIIFSMTACDGGGGSRGSSTTPTPLVFNETVDGKEVEITISETTLSERSVITPKTGNFFRIDIDKKTASLGTITLTSGNITFKPSANSPCGVDEFKGILAGTTLIITEIPFDGGTISFETGIPTLTVTHFEGYNNTNTPYAFTITVGGIKGWELKADQNYDVRWSLLDIFETVRVPGDDHGADCDDDCWCYYFGGWSHGSTFLSAHLMGGNQGSFTFSGKKANFNADFFKASNIESLLPGRTRQQIWDMIVFDFKGDLPFIVSSPVI